MKYLKLFESFDDTLHIFDFDDTLVKTPTFEELAIEFLKEDLSIRDMLQVSVDRIGARLSDLKWENGRLYIEDPSHRMNVVGNWIQKGKRIYLLTPHKFPFTDISLPSGLKDLANLYNKIENKCIVTARPEDMRDKIIDVMHKLELESPKYGLHMFPAGKGSGNPGLWKGSKIVELIKKTGFKKAHFYDDNSKIVNRVERIVNKELHNIDFKVTKVK